MLSARTPQSFAWGQVMEDLLDPQPPPSLGGGDCLNREGGAAKGSLEQRCFLLRLTTTTLPKKSCDGTLIAPFRQELVRSVPQFGVVQETGGLFRRISEFVRMSVENPK